MMTGHKLSNRRYVGYVCMYIHIYEDLVRGGLFNRSEKVKEAQQKGR